MHNAARGPLPSSEIEREERTEGSQGRWLENRERESEKEMQKEREREICCNAPVWPRHDV
jgi:hypothetical protein